MLLVVRPKLSTPSSTWPGSSLGLSASAKRISWRSSHLTWKSIQAAYSGLNSALLARTVFVAAGGCFRRLSVGRPGAARPGGAGGRQSDHPFRSDSCVSRLPECQQFGGDSSVLHGLF